MSAAIRVVVADDHQMFRAGVIELLESAPHITVVAQCRDGHAAADLASEHRPDILILDVEMPGPGAAPTIRRVSEVSPGTGTVVLTMHDAPDVVRDVFAAGARAYLLKSVGRPELLAAINTASQSLDAVLLSVSRTTLMSLSGHSSAAQNCLLSPRELEVLVLLAEGKNNRDIAAELFISEGTVKRHLANIYGKLQATSRLEAVRRAEQLGVLGAARTFTPRGEGGQYQVPFYQPMAGGRAQKIRRRVDEELDVKRGVPGVEPHAHLLKAQPPAREG